MTQEDIIRDIRVRCRQAMNGIVSTSMRKWGLDYKVNFGLTIQQIKDVSKRYSPDASLAETLWIENTRELKIMGTLLYPVDKYQEETADKWVQEITNQEIREQICFNLLQELPYAENLSMKWSKNQTSSIRTTGYWLLSRLMLLKKSKDILPESLPYVWEDVLSEDASLRNAALLILKHIGRLSEDTAETIMQKISEFQKSEDILKQEIYNSLNFEFGYFFDN
ncbi:peptidase [Bacteroidia bacterium]|nr:peptidase [Bacteroidia bacterium]GHV38312.1 peptidase [Bacteroidia bacterium]